MTITKLQDAATVVLLRDGADGLEVLMAKRNATTRFSAGAYVFPGGAVDEADSEVLHHCHSVDESDSDRDFGEAAAQRYYVAAARELFEEVGLWMFDDEQPQHAETARRQLHAGDLNLEQLLCDRSRLSCGLSALKYFRFWTTPPGLPRRYRTRFFAALAPADQVAVVDGIELTELCWTSPAHMLQRYQAKDVQLIFPTIKELEFLSEFSNAEDAWSAISEIEQVEEIRTRHRIIDGRSIEVLLPGDEGYSDLPAW
ncbi:MAG: NUDIX hydrolase [Oceanococcus sp.]